MKKVLGIPLATVAVLLIQLAVLDRLAPFHVAPLVVAAERWRAGLRPERVQVGDFEVAYNVGGEGEPLILLHGFGANRENFTRVAGQLTRSHRVLVPDLPGFGESSRRADARYAIDDQVERLRAFVRAVGYERVHLGGSSMGGFIATRWAALHPTEVASLWLLAPSGTRVAYERSEMRRSIEERGINPLLSKRPDEYARTLEYVMHDPPFVPSSILRMLAEEAAANHAGNERIFAQTHGPDSPAVDDQLAGIAIPALVVWGREDRTLSAEAAEVYAERMPEARVIVLEEIGHLPMLEAPARVAEDWLAFRAGHR